MTVQCNKADTCRQTECPHFEEHDPMWGLEYVGGRGETLTCYCDRRTCGQREPWIEVQCVVKVKQATEVARERQLQPA